MELLAGDKLGKYEVVGRLAAGGMAEVYLARILGHGGFAKPVALKRMLPSLASEPGFREMFMQEASLAARLNHPHVVQIFDFAEERGELYLAMEFVHGVTLRKLHADALARAKADASLRMPPLLAGYVVRCIAHALSHAWSVADDSGNPLHLIHRDVSPHNVLLSYEGAVKLADFGIAKPAGMHTSVGVLKGKLLYMAPEQLGGGTLDARTDVFALGIVLYETAMALRRPLFDAGKEQAVAQAVRERQVVPPARMDPDFPPGLSALIMKALERDPERRFQNAAQMAEALGESLHREAKGPQEYDLVAFMRRLYGDPPAVRGLSQAPPAPAAGQASPSRAPDALDRIGDDASAETVPRARVEELRAAALSPPPAPVLDPDVGAPAAKGLRPTVRERPRPPDEAVEVAARAELAAADSVAKVQKAPASPPADAAAARSRSPTPADSPRSKAGQPPTAQRPRWLVPALAAVAGVLGLTAGLLALRQPSPQGTSLGAPTVKAPVPDLAAPGLDAGPVVAMPPRVVEPLAPAVEPDAGAPLAAVAPSPPHPPATAPARPAASPGPAAAAPHRADKRTGSLVIYIKPWVHAWIDSEPFTGGADQEAAPRLTRSLTAGRHQVHLRDGAGREKQLEVVITPDRPVVVEGVLDKLEVR